MGHTRSTWNGSQRDPGRPPPPPEGQLIRERRGEVSIRAAAKQAGISEATWRISEYGHRLEPDLADRPYDGSPAVIAKMAAVVGVSPDELDATGRPNAIKAADLMRRQRERPDGEGPEFADVILALTGIERSARLTRAEKRDLYARVAALLAEFRRPGLDVG